MHLIELADEISCEPAAEFALSCSGQGLDDLPIEENLAWKAAQVFAAALSCELPPLHVHIEKHIPAGAGLAGGSADAAAVLTLLARECAHKDSLAPLAAGLGADVPFFLCGSSACLMGGFGDELLSELRPAAGLPVVIAWDPTAPVATAEVYQAFDSQTLPVDEAGEAALVTALNCADIEQLTSHLYNNLSAAAFAVSPAARRVNELLAGSVLSGSGGASFLLCDSAEDASAWAARVRAAGLAACVTELASQSTDEDRRQ
ncbi:MAG: hypothetical protein FWC48_04600 [Actinomycetia bacterium]|nr:hypothetical protein [Actinomycetes bacterium]